MQPHTHTGSRASTHPVSTGRNKYTHTHKRFDAMCKGVNRPWFHQREIRSREGENVITPSMGHLSSHQMVDHTHVNSQHLGLINSV